MGGLPVQGLPGGQSFGHASASQGTPFRLPLQSALKGLQSGFQVDAKGLFPEEFRGSRNGDRSPAKGQYGRAFRIFFHDFLQRLFFHPAEGGFSVGLKNLRNAFSHLFLHDGVQIQERAAQGFGHQAPDGAFPAPHKSGQGDEHDQIDTFSYN